MKVIVITLCLCTTPKIIVSLLIHSMISVFKPRFEVKTKDVRVSPVFGDVVL